MALKICRYHVYWADLDPTRGSELRKVRPVLVISPDEMNASLKTVVVCPLTSKLRSDWYYRHTVTIGSAKSDIAVDQIRTLSKERLSKHLGKISAKDVATVQSIVKSLYGE